MVAEHKQYNLSCHEVLYPLREGRQYVDFVNITNSRKPGEARHAARRRCCKRELWIINRMAESSVPGREHGQGRDLVEKLIC